MSDTDYPQAVDNSPRGLGRSGVPSYHRSGDQPPTDTVKGRCVVKRRNLAAVAAAIGLAAGASVLATGAGTPPVPQPNPPGVDLCTLPVADRVGGWFCPAPVEEQRAGLAENLGIGLTGGGPKKTMVAGDGVTGYCLTTGCWYKSSNIEASISVRGWYGYGSTSLGTANLWTTDKINVYEVITKPQSKVTSPRSTYNNKWVTQRYWATGSSTNPGGPVDPPVYRQSGWFSACGGCGADFAPVYLSDKSSGYEYTMHSIRWSDPIYPGTWYINAKSVRMALSTNGTGYYFMGDWDTPSLIATPLASGWYA